MKKITAVFASALVLISLTGCTDASAKLKDSNTTILTVNGKKITKGEIYAAMSGSGAASTAISDATKVVVNAEVEVTDDMKSQADQTVAYYQTVYGDSFTKYLAESGMTTEDYTNQYILPSIQEQELPKKYVEENFDALVEQYNPVKATILKFTSEDDANSALGALKNGSDAAAAATAYNSTSDGKSAVETNESGLDSAVWSMLVTAVPDDGWCMVPGSTSGTYYCLRVDENDASAMKDDVVTAISSISAVSTDATTYYFKKYKFHVYDITLYNDLKENYADYLVQAK